MKKLSREDVKKICDKWSHVLNSPSTGCKVMLLESQEKVHTIDDVINSIPDEVFDYYIENFKHDSDNNPTGYINLLVKHKMNKIYE